MGVWIETITLSGFAAHPLVTPYVGVWIETIEVKLSENQFLVTPYVGVWIETPKGSLKHNRDVSLLMWECGLKRQIIDVNGWLHTVTPYVGVWIETEPHQCFPHNYRVTPYVGVWIETALFELWSYKIILSLLMWECGLKHKRFAR